MALAGACQAALVHYNCTLVFKLIPALCPASDTHPASMVDLTAFNTLALAATAQSLVSCDHTTPLAELSAMAADHEQVFVLGGGSNVVLMPRIQSLVIHVRSRGIRVLQDDAQG